MRSGAKAIEDDTEKRLSIPITVRQLEAIIRIAESMAKMELTPFAVDRHIEEALRLFQVQFQFSNFFIFTTTMLGITSSNVRDHFTRKKKFFPFWQWYYRAFNRQLRIWYIDHLQNFAGTVQMLIHIYILYVWRIRWWPNFNYLWFCDKIVD